MKRKARLGTILIILAVFFSVAGFSYSQAPVATLDGKQITKTILANYVNDIAGSNYESWLNNDEGLQKLASFYINRTLLLEYAKQNIKKDETIIKSHNFRSVDEETMVLTTMLKAEVHDQAQASEASIARHLKKNSDASYEQAKAKIESDIKKELMEELIQKVRNGHDIQIY